MPWIPVGRVRHDDAGGKHPKRVSAHTHEGRDASVEQPGVTPLEIEA